MSEAQPTSGPWRVHDLEIQARLNPQKGDGWFTIATAQNDLLQMGDEAAANLNLLATARDLLTACQALIAHCDKNPPMGDSLWSVQQIRAAVKKVTAQP